MLRYKVVKQRHFDGVYISMYAQLPLYQELNLEHLGRIYPINEWAEAHPRAIERGYGLCVFDSLRHADYFCGASDCIIFKCEVNPEDSIPLPSKGRLNLCFGERPMWVDQLMLPATKPWPVGTEMFKKVKITTRFPPIKEV